MDTFSSTDALDCLDTHQGKGIVGFRHLAQRNRTVVVFIHGLGGSSFGRKRTWVNLPEFVWADEPDVDVAFHSYDTLGKRLLFWRSVSLRDEAGALADSLKLLPYDHIILVGHSLGGILARLTLKELADRKEEGVLSKIVSVILMASPTLGARWINALFGWLTHDLRALQRDGDVVRDIEQLYNGRLSPRFNRKLHTAECVPLWAVTAAADRWVSRLSASAQVPDTQRRSVIGSHTQVVKPQSKSAPAYGHFMEMLRRIVDECEPAAVRRITVKGHEIRPATAADSAAVFDLARRAFPGERISSAETMVTWLGWDPYCFWIIKELATVGGAIKGYWCAFSLTAPALKAIKAGELTGPQLKFEHFADGPHDQAGIYVGAIVGSGDYFKGLVMKHARRELSRRTGGQIVEIVARAVTEDGLKLVKTLGFAGIDGDQLGSVFSGTSTVRTRRRRR